MTPDHSPQPLCGHIPTLPPSRTADIPVRSDVRPVERPGNWPERRHVAGLSRKGSVSRRHAGAPALVRGLCQRPRLTRHFFWARLPWLLLAAFPFLTSAASQPHLSDYIRPFVGTQGEGNTYPGPSAPFGMIQLSPDTDRDLWDTASGYEYSDTSIMGFTLTHLTGTGIPDLGDFLFMPQIGEPKLVVGTKENPDAGYRARYSHDQESAAAGYYKVKLLNNNVTVELTAGQRAGMMRFTFPQSD